MMDENLYVCYDSAFMNTIIFFSQTCITIYVILKKISDSVNDLIFLIDLFDRKIERKNVLQHFDIQKIFLRQK